MDRRRFVPSPEGLEGRMLLSVARPSSAIKAARTPVANTSSTLAEKELRIERLPFFLETLQPGRALPGATIARLQADLNTIVARLQPPPSQVLDAFNLGLRDVIPNASLSVEDARTLNRLFGEVLAAAGAPPQSVANLQADMSELIQADTNGPNPVMLATNDYALVLQTALGVGRPIKAPAPPKLAAADRARGLGPNVTANRQPTLTGTYASGHTIEILDAEDDLVLGAGPVGSDGTYAAKFSSPLEDGTYKVRVTAIDAEGHVSSPSRIYTLKVVTRASRPDESWQAPKSPRGFAIRTRGRVDSSG